MSAVQFVLLLTLIPVVRQHSLIPSLDESAPNLETTNAYLRSFLPWWPKDEQFTLRAAPPLDLTRSSNDSQSSGNQSEILNSTLSLSTEELPQNYTELPLAEQKVHEIPSSPLDELAPAPVAPNHLAESSRDGNFIINFDEMGECPRDCSKDLQEALSLVLQEMSHVERYQKICGKYNGAITCVHEDQRCDNEDRGMFEMMTSGLNYMCVEQELAFNATIKCIDDEAGLVQSECENQCQTRNLFMNWIMRTAMKDTIQQGVNGIVGAATGTNANPLAFLQPTGAEGQPGWADMLGNLGKPQASENPQEGFENFRQFTNDLCRIGDCMLDCIRSKFNTRCEGSAGTLLSEVLVRPIAASQNKLQLLRPIMGMFMPEQCAYLHSNSDLKKHRIDSTMDEELKRMYTEKAAKEIRERTEQDELLSNLVPLDENGVPLPRALPDLDAVDSPLDVSVKTLDQLILDMYTKNDTKELKDEELAATKKEIPSVTTTAAPAETSTTLDELMEMEVTSEEPTGSAEPEGSGTLTAYSDGSGESEASGSGARDFKTSSGTEEASGETRDSKSSDNQEPVFDGSGHIHQDNSSVESSGESSGDRNGSGDTRSYFELHNVEVDSEASGALESSGESSGSTEYSSMLGESNL